MATTGESGGDEHWPTASAVLVSNDCHVAVKQPLRRAEIDAALAAVRKRWKRESPFARHAQALHGDSARAKAR